MGCRWKVFYSNYFIESRVFIHTEISKNEVEFGKCIYQSPICEVWKGTPSVWQIWIIYAGVWKGKQVAIKQFDEYSAPEDLRKEVALLRWTLHEIGSVILKVSQMIGK